MFFFGIFAAYTAFFLTFSRFFAVLFVLPSLRQIHSPRQKRPGHLTSEALCIFIVILRSFFGKKLRSARSAAFRKNRECE